MLRRFWFALMALGAAWRTYRYAVGLPIWGDEAFLAINFVWRDFGGMLKPLVYGQIAPLGFMWSELAVSRILGYSEWALHLVPYVCGMIALLSFDRFAARTLPRCARLLATGIFAGSFFIVRHSCEVKPYSSDLLLSLMMTMLGWSVYQHRHSLGRWVGLALLAGVGVWCSYPFMFVGGAVGLLLTVLLIEERFAGKFVLRWAVFGVVLCCSAAAMYVWYGRPQAHGSAELFEMASWSRTFPPSGGPWAWFVWLLRMCTGNLFAYPQGGAPPGSVVTFALFVVGCVRLWHRGRALLLLLLAPFVLNVVAAAFHAYPFGGSARVAQHLAPAICLLAGLGLAVVLRRLLPSASFRRGLVIGAVVLMILPVGDMVWITVRPYKQAKVWKGQQAVLDVAGQTQAGDRWVVFNARDRVEYAPYLGDWRGVGGQFVFDVARFAPVDVAWAPPPGQVEAPPGRRVWLLVYYARTSKVVFPDDQLTAYVDTLTGRLGMPKTQSFELERKRSGVRMIRVFEFDPRRRHAPGNGA